MATTARQYAQALYTLTEGATKQKASLAVKTIADRLAGEGRQDLLEGVLLEYKRILLQRNALPEISVESAEELSNEVKKEIIKSFGADENITIREVVNSFLIAGARIKYNDLFLDTSAQGKLVKLKKQLL